VGTQADFRDAIPDGLDIYLVGKAYTVHEAAKLAGTTDATVRRWLQGYDQPGHRMAPVFDTARTANEAQPLMVSFIELIEIVVVARFRKGSSANRPLSLERLRMARTHAREALGVAYPFASLKLLRFGGHVLHEFEVDLGETGLLALDLGGQWVLPGLVREEMQHNIDFDDLFAQRWFPRGRDAKLVVDPRIAAGRMTVVGFGVTVDTLQARWRHGEPIESLARDYGIPRATIEEILQHAA
jgi:uncharacterized protein (DUF433 family)